MVIGRPGPDHHEESACRAGLLQCVQYASQIEKVRGQSANNFADSICVLSFTLCPLALIPDL